MSDLLEGEHFLEGDFLDALSEFTLLEDSLPSDEKLLEELALFEWGFLGEIREFLLHRCELQVKFRFHFAQIERSESRDKLLQESTNCRRKRLNGHLRSRLVTHLRVDFRHLSRVQELPRTLLEELPPQLVK